MAAAPVASPAERGRDGGFSLNSPRGEWIANKLTTREVYMVSRKKVRLVFTFASVGLLSLLSATSEAGRSVRSDASDNAFEFLGGFWGDNTEQFGGPGQSVRTQFKLRFSDSSGARYYTVCMS